jgi:hypothetical protein
VSFGVFGRWTEDRRAPALLLLAAPWVLTSAAEWAVVRSAVSVSAAYLHVRTGILARAACALELGVYVSIVSMVARYRGQALVFASPAIWALRAALAIANEASDSFIDNPAQSRADMQ